MITDEERDDSPAAGDRDARAAITAHCPVVTVQGAQWFDMEGTRVSHLDEVTDALLWLEERGETTEGFRAVRSPIYPNLIRFEDLLSDSLDGSGHQTGRDAEVVRVEPGAAALARVAHQAVTDADDSRQGNHPPSDCAIQQQEGASGVSVNYFSESLIAHGASQALKEAAVEYSRDDHATGKDASSGGQK